MRAVPVGRLHGVAEPLFGGVEIAPGAPVTACADGAFGVAGADVRDLTRDEVDAGQTEVLRLRVGGAVVRRVHGHEEAVAPTPAHPLIV